MNDTPAEVAVERAEARAARRRWITLAELLGIAAVVISALTLWNNYSDRRSGEAERHAEAQRKAEGDAAASRSRSVAALVGTPASNGQQLRITDPRRRIERITVTFPASLKVDEQTSTLDPAIAADWIAAPILSLTDGGADRIEGRLPVTIAATWWDGADERTDRAIYDLVFRTEGRMLAGRSFRLRGIVLRERVAGDAARLDTLWARELGRLGSPQRR